MKPADGLFDFTRWKQQHFPNEVFYCDGIINPAAYGGTSPKILFIAKEPNATNHKGEGPYRSFCDEWNNDKPGYGFALRIAEWAYGIINDFPLFDKIDHETRHAYLKKIAFMNLKKSGGGGNLKNRGDFNTLVKGQIDFIRQQMQFIRPDIIVLGISQSSYLKDLLFPDQIEQWKDSGYGVKIVRASGARVVDFYHPSSRNVAAAAYSLLQNIVRNANFQQL